MKSEHVQTGEIVLYQPDNTIRLEVLVEDETVWLTQAQMSILFGRDRTVIGKHIRNIFTEGELHEDKVCAIFAHTTQHGAIKGKTQTKDIVSYNLDVIISVGYRVKSKQGTKFRQWANPVLKEYLIRGYAINRRIEQVEKFAIEAGQKSIEVSTRLDLLIREIEDVLKYQNDINEDTRMQLELLNQSLAGLQSKRKELDKPRRRIGYGTKDEFI